MRKVLWLAVSCLIGAAFVLASCTSAAEAPTEVQTIEDEETTEAPAQGEEEPEYGGTLTYAISGWFSVFDPIISAADWFYLPVYSPLVGPDITRGPRGTGEVALAGFVPDEFLVGYAASSWEQPDLTHLVFHIRKGVRFQDKPPLNGREMTAEDVVFSFNYNFSHPKSTMYSPQGETGYSVALDPADPWTVIVTLPAESVTDMLDVGWSLMVLPPEIEDDIDNWEFANGTGPFVVTDVLQGSSLTYERHPQYWQSDPFNPENQLPYVDGIKMLVIPDIETRLAALRTGKIDRLGAVTQEQALILQDTAPRLLASPEAATNASILEMMTDREPFSSKEVRRAISMAIDHPGLKNALRGGAADMLSWPLAAATAGGAYTPLGELPESTQKLFGYYPEEAKQLLADAGYPTGFRTEIATTANYVDEAAIVQYNLREIGIDVDIVQMESGAYWGMVFGHNTPQMSLSYWGSEYPNLMFSSAFYHTGGVPHAWNFSAIIDEHIVETWDTIKATVDPVERTRLLKELNIYALDMSYNIQLPAAYTYTFWQPWVKNYMGEATIGAAYDSGIGIIKHLWIDQDLKYEITGDR